MTNKIQYIFLFFILSYNSASQALSLEETDIGKAVIEENITDYRRALDQTSHLPYDKAVEIITATDSEGNNLLHLMAQVQKSREAFAGEMIQLSIILIDFLNIQDIFEQFNKEGLPPHQIAIKEKNSIAAAYLATIVNKVKNMRNNAVNIKKQAQTVSGELVVTVPKLRIAQHGTGGAILALSGFAFASAGIALGDPIPAIIGAAKIGIGGNMCYHAFKILRNK